MKTTCKALVYILIFSFTVFSCEGLLDDEVVEEGQYMFWSNFDGPPIDVFINGSKYGTISSFYSNVPLCDAAGCVTVYLTPGAYTFRATEQSMMGSNSRTWEGTILVEVNVCKSKGLSI